MAGPSDNVVKFAEFSLDAANVDLRRSGEVVRIRPKTLAVLEYLTRRPSRLVTKAELLEAVWPGTAVGEWVLTGCVQELRRLLGDDPRRPRLIETVHGRGYRFIGQVETAPAAADVALAGCMVGRLAEFDELDGWLRRAAAGTTQVGFIAGEAGIGKTAFIDEFTRRRGGRDGPAQRRPADAAGHLVARGQCIEQHAGSEPYFPVLEALGRLCAGEECAQLVEVLHRHAPAWLAQLPGVLPAPEAAALDQRLGATMGDRMLREFVSFAGALPAPLVLIIEDLHWSDNATTELVAMLARHPPAARLLVLATYRPLEAAIGGHRSSALPQELLAQGSCRFMDLPPLGVAEVAQYLRSRWSDIEPLEPLAQLVHQHTDGNALFVANVVEHLNASGAVARIDGRWQLQGPIESMRVGVPDTVRQLIALRVARLDESERTALEAGSLIGRTFSAALVAAALDADVVETEERLSRLAQIGHMVCGAGESRWPDGTAAGAYQLTHYLYGEAIRDRVPPARRQILHQRIAARMERAFGNRADEIAVDLAYHLEASGQPDRALPYLEQAVDRAVRRGAPRDALTTIDHGLEILDTLPSTPERAAIATRLYLARGMSLVPVRGFSDPEIVRSCQRARVLSEESGDLIQLFRALSTLTGVYLAQARLGDAAEAAAEMLDRLHRLPIPPAMFAAHTFTGVVAYYAGTLAEARQHLETAKSLGDVAFPAASSDPRLFMLGHLGLTLLHQGCPDDAQEHVEHALALAKVSGRPFDFGLALQVACTFLMHSGDVVRLGSIAEIASNLGADQGYRAVAAIGDVGRGRSCCAERNVERGIELMRAGIAAYRESGQRVALPTLLAAFVEGLLAGDQLPQALECVLEARATSEASGELRYRAELHRLEGEIRLRCGDTASAEKCFRLALHTARQQGTRWWELRAAVSWYRMQPPAKRRVARRNLAAVTRSFAQGLSTALVREAHALLAEHAAGDHQKLDGAE